MFCSLKIAVCVPKITIISKSCRLKIPMRVRVYACMIDENRTRDHNGTPTEYTTTGKERNAGNTGKPAYICMISCAEKSIKKV